MSRYPYSATNNGTLAQIGSGPIDLTLFQVWNNDAAIRYVQMFDVAAASQVVLGTTVATRRMLLPASGGNTWDGTIKFVHGCFIAVTTTRTGAVAPTAPADVEASF